MTDSSNNDRMLPWVAEKADSVVSAALLVLQILRDNKVQVDGHDGHDQEFLFSFLYRIVHDGTKLSAYGHGDLEPWSTEWPKRIFDEGELAWNEFLRALG